MEKINIAELLKDCPKGMELDCTMFDNVVFNEVTNMLNFPISILVDKRSFSLTKYGEWECNNKIAKCVIFPKGKDSWEGFVPPCQFKNGDIVVTTLNNIAIIKEHVKKELFYANVLMVGDDFYNDKNIQVFVKRHATEEEKERLLKE